MPIDHDSADSLDVYQPLKMRTQSDIVHFKIGRERGKTSWDDALDLYDLHDLHFLAVRTTKEIGPAPTVAASTCPR
jgi:hypothetical protein